MWLDSDVADAGRAGSAARTRGRCCATAIPAEIVARLKAEREAAYAEAPIKVMSDTGPHGDTVNRILQELDAWL